MKSLDGTAIECRLRCLATHFGSKWTWLWYYDMRDAFCLQSWGRDAAIVTAPIIEDNWKMRWYEVQWKSEGKSHEQKWMKWVWNPASRASTLKANPKTQWKQWKNWKMKRRGKCPPVLHGWPPARVCEICWPNWLVRKLKTPKEISTLDLTHRITLVWGFQTGKPRVTWEHQAFFRRLGFWLVAPRSMLSVPAFSSGLYFSSPEMRLDSYTYWPTNPFFTGVAVQASKTGHVGKQNKSAGMVWRQQVLGHSRASSHQLDPSGLSSPPQHFIVNSNWNNDHWTEQLRWHSMEQQKLSACSRI